MGTRSIYSPPPELLVHSGLPLGPSLGHSPVICHRGQVEPLGGEADGAQGAAVDFTAGIQRGVQRDVAVGGDTITESALSCHQPLPQGRLPELRNLASQTPILPPEAEER